MNNYPPNSVAHTICTQKRIKDENEYSQMKNGFYIRPLFTGVYQLFEK